MISHLCTLEEISLINFTLNSGAKLMMCFNLLFTKNIIFFSPEMKNLLQLLPALHIGMHNKINILNINYLLHIRRIKSIYVTIHFMIIQQAVRVLFLKKK